MYKTWLCAALKHSYIMGWIERYRSDLVTPTTKCMLQNIVYAKYNKMLFFIQWWSNGAIFCMQKKIKLNNLHFNCPSSLIVVTTNHNVFRHKSLRIICGWIYAGYSEILCDTLYNWAANCWGLWVMRVTSWPPAFSDCHLLLVLQHSMSPQAIQYPK